MKPTRNIVTPTKGLWLAKRRVWFQKNDDFEADEKQASENITKITKKMKDDEFKKEAFKRAKKTWGKNVGYYDHD